MHARTIRAWTWTHKWSSLISTLFLLMLCVTGLPLVILPEASNTRVVSKVATLGGDAAGSSRPS